MRENELWNTFTETGKVEDYLTYAKERNRYKSASAGQRYEEVSRLERASDGNGAVGGDHWRVR